MLCRSTTGPERLVSGVASHHMQAVQCGKHLVGHFTSFTYVIKFLLHIQSASNVLQYLQAKLIRDDCSKFGGGIALERICKGQLICNIA